MLRISIENINNKLTDKLLIKNTALALANKYKYYLLYKQYFGSTKDYTLWIYYKDSLTDEGRLWDYLNGLLEDSFFESFEIKTLERVQTYEEIMQDILKDPSLKRKNIEAFKVEYREYKTYDKTSKTWKKNADHKNIH